MASNKGGCGKSTLAIHLAVTAHMMGCDTVLADLDAHSQTVKEWASIRENTSPLVLSASPEDVPALQQQARDEKFQLMILDCPPCQSPALQSVLAIADLVVAPMQPRFADLQALPHFVNAMAGNYRYTVVLNACTPGLLAQPSTKTREIMALLTKHKIPVADVWLTHREALADALHGGQAIREYAPDTQAALDIQKLWAYLRQQLLATSPHKSA